LGSFPEKFTNVKFKENRTVISIINDKGEYLDVPYKYVQLLNNVPRGLLAKIVKPVEDQRLLTVGVADDGNYTEVKITPREKPIFYNFERDEGILFPELKHGQAVNLEGIITKGNAKSNTLGIDYKEHVLTCIPSEGNIRRFRELLFSKCKITGVIDRMDKIGRPSEKRPKVIFDMVVPLEKGSRNLFDFIKK
jgi:hypothetical protein